MKYWTWAEIRAKVEAEIDLEDENFVRPAELLGYANEAIDEAEAEIHTLYEDYFLKFVDIPITANTEYISVATQMPDIYADKIRRIIYKNQGNSVYTLNRIRDWKKFEQKSAMDQQSSTDLLEYFLVNRTPGNPEILLVPKAYEAGTMKVWYLRNANRLATDTDICDIPEFINFVFAHIKVKVYGKEGHPGYPEAMQKLEQERERMNAVLSNRVPDADNEIDMDLSAYNEMN